MERAQYYRQIYIYKKRRIELKKKYELTGKERYRECYNGLTRKISYWNLAIRRIDERKKKIKLLTQCVNKYFDVKIESRTFNTKHKLARSIYYKIGMESGLRGIWLCSFIGRKYRTAELGRKHLTQSFETNEKNHEAFYQFKKYFETT